jgi:hypothetical protein
VREAVATTIGVAGDESINIASDAVYAAFGATTFGMRTRGPTRNVICLTFL